METILIIAIIIFYLISCAMFGIIYMAVGGRKRNFKLVIISLFYPITFWFIRD